MDLQKRVLSFLFLIFMSLLHLSSITIAAVIDPNYEYHFCGTTGNYTQNSTYQKNLNTLLSSLSDKVNDYGFYNGSVGRDDSERTTATVLCRGDVELNTCRSCVTDNSQIVQQLCPTQKEAFRWYNICSVFYSDRPILGTLQIHPEIVQYSGLSVQHPVEFNQSLTGLVDRLRKQAAGGGSFLKFAAGNASGPDNQTIYAYVQCTPDLSVQECTDCLTTAFTSWSTSKGNGTIGARVLQPSCFFRYEISSFFGTGLIKKSAPPLPPVSGGVSTPTSPPPAAASGKDDKRSPIFMTIAVSIALGHILGIMA